MATDELNRKLIDFEGASKLYSDLRSKLEAGDEAQSNALKQHAETKTGNPHNVTKKDLGLELVDNTADASKNVATAGKWTTPRTVNFDGASTDVTGSFTLDGSGDVSGISLAVKDNSHSHSIDNVTGLQDALNSKVSNGQFDSKWDAKLDEVKGKVNGLATLDENSKVPQSQLPSYVDDVIEANDFASLPTEGESGKIYVTIDTGKTYRWGGSKSKYVEISSSIVVGTTTGTAYDGKLGTDLAAAIGDSGDAATEDTAFGRIKKTADALGTINTASDTTAFGKIKKLEDAVGGSGGTSLKDQIDDLRTDLGQPGDLSSVTTSAFGRIKKTEEDIAKIDLTKDSAKNVATAKKWTNSVNITLTGDATSAATPIDGSADVNIAVTVDGSKHSHTTAQITDFTAKHAEKLDAATFKTAFTDKFGTATGIATPTEIQTSIIDNWKAPANA